MEEQASHIETLFEKTERYTRVSVDLYKLKAIDKSADVLSTLVARLAVAAFIILFFLILNIGIALWLGELFGRSCYGFFTVAGFYALAGIILYVFRKQWIQTPLRNSIITQAIG